MNRRSFEQLYLQMSIPPLAAKAQETNGRRIFCGVERPPLMVRRRACAVSNHEATVGPSSFETRPTGPREARPDDKLRRRSSGSGPVWLGMTAHDALAFPKRFTVSNKITKTAAGSERIMKSPICDMLGIEF